VSVSVVDFFGNPISNANVTVNGPSPEQLTALTRGDGTASFNNIIGGNLQIVAFAPGEESNYQAVTLTVDKPTSVQIKMDRFIVFGSMLIEASSFIAIIIIVVAVILLIVVELFWRRRARHASAA
jgi:Ca2+/Na+ antiporter